MRSAMIRILSSTLVLAASFAASVVAADEPVPTISGLDFIGSMTVPDKKSPHFGIHHFYLNDTARPAFDQGTSYPAGALFVGKIYAIVEEFDVQTEGALRFTSVMMKTPEMSETAGWAYGLFAPDGKAVPIDPKTLCLPCHAKVKDRDYVFSKPLQ